MTAPLVHSGILNCLVNFQSQGSVATDVVEQGTLGGRLNFVRITTAYLRLQQLPS